MSIDTRSLMLASALILAASSLALYVLQRMRTTVSGPGWWAAGNAVGFVSLLLLAARGVIPDLLSITLANGLLIAALCINVAGLRVFLGAGLPSRAIWLLPLAVMAESTWFFMVTPSHRVRLIAASLLFCILSFKMSYDLSTHGERTGDGKLPAAQAFAFWVTVAYGAIFLLRTILGIFFLTPESALAPHPLTTGAYVVGILLSFLNTFSLFLMTSERLQQELQRQASHDHLTGIPNRRAFHMLARHEIGRARRTFDPLAMLLLDLDHFKQVNDRFGHAAGDTVLRDFSSMITAAVREQDIVCRFGGEEFVILLPGTGLAGALALAERVRFLAESRPVEFSGNRIAYTVSIGLALSTTDDTTIETVLERADRALYRAKSEGRNRVSTEAGDAVWATGADGQPSSPPQESNA